MKLTFLGSGDAFSTIPINYQSNLLLEDNADCLLIDCGSHAQNSLNTHGLTYSHIRHVYISHLHADHIGGLEWLGFSSYFDVKCKKPTLYLHHDIKKTLWNNSLSGGMNCLEDKRASLSTYFNVHSCFKYFTWNQIRFYLIQTTHAYQNKKKLPCYGLFFKLNDTRIYMTGDTQFTPQYLMPYYKKADLIFHDCDTSNSKKTIHSPYKKLVTLPYSIKQKMWLYHYQDHRRRKPKQDGFRGFVKKGQCFRF